MAGFSLWHVQACAGVPVRERTEGGKGPDLPNNELEELLPDAALIDTRLACNITPHRRRPTGRRKEMELGGRSTLREDGKRTKTETKGHDEEGSQTFKHNLEWLF